jgi:hypothetical protein
MAEDVTKDNAAMRDRLHSVVNEIYEDLTKASKTFNRTLWISEPTKKTSERLVLISAVVVLLTQGWLLLRGIKSFDVELGPGKSRFTVPVVAAITICYFTVDLLVAFASDRRTWNLDQEDCIVRANSSITRISLETIHLDAKVAALNGQLETQRDKRQKLLEIAEERILRGDSTGDDYTEADNLECSIAMIDLEVKTLRSLRDGYLRNAHDYSKNFLETFSKRSRKLFDVWTVLPLIAASVAMASAVTGIWRAVL